MHCQQGKTDFLTAAECGLAGQKSAVTLILGATDSHESYVIQRGADFILLWIEVNIIDLTYLVEKRGPRSVVPILKLLLFQ